MQHPSPIVPTEFRGLPALHLQAGDGASAVVLLHGAQLVSWIPAGGSERLYLSPQAVFDGRQPVRGGVPVIFPQFDRSGPLPRHGFARDRGWGALSIEQGAHDALAVLRLSDDEATQRIWPHRFSAELTLRIGGPRLDIELAIEHRGDAEAAQPPPLRFTAALHSYLRVAEVSEVRLDGLHRLRYLDKVRAVEQVDSSDRLQPQGELDRIYFDAARPLRLRDGELALEISKQGFADVVVWNPGAERCAMLADMPPDGWREMLCIEAAAIGTPVEVAAGECWIGRQSISVGPAAAAAG